MTLPAELLRSVSREEVNALPIRRYEGEVRVVSAPQDVAPALADILQEPVVGFDTETRPAFRPGESYSPSLAQAATGRAVYLFQVRHREAAAAVAQMLASAHVVKAGVGLADDLKALKKLVEFSERSIVDLGAVATRHGLKQTGVRNLTGLFLGFRIPKGTKTSNWSRSQLTSQQIAYAATDAWACRELYLRFSTLGLN
ncbi:MAG TPA: 3'-5' exonuclease [Burkholderiales bacterium]